MTTKRDGKNSSIRPIRIGRTLLRFERGVSGGHMLAALYEAL